MYTGRRMRGDLAATAGGEDQKIVEMTVSATAEGDQWRIRIDGRELLVDAVRIKRGTWALPGDGRSVVVVCGVLSVTWLAIVRGVLNRSF